MSEFERSPISRGKTRKIQSSVILYTYGWPRRMEKLSEQFESMFPIGKEKT